MGYERDLERAVAAAKEAGAKLATLSEQPKQVLSEIGRDIKLQADRDAEAIILDMLADSGYPVLAEESGEHGDVQNTNALVWVVDPLDGTLNFSRGIPLCCTSIALCRGFQPLLGVIYDFNRDELFTAITGEGAWRNGAPMQVSGITDKARAILTSGFPTAGAYGDDALAKFVRHVQQYKKLRLLGSAALMLAYVAAGRYEAYGEEDIMWWDVAAGAALVREAGGYVSIEPSASTPWALRIRAASHPALWE
ncbi:MAG: inositol monophosphatase family protein [Candidatus Hydrogenedentota bacterium]